MHDSFCNNLGKHVKSLIIWKKVINLAVINIFQIFSKICVDK